MLRHVFGAILGTLLLADIATATILPPNNLDREDNIFEFSPSVSEAQFNQIIARGQQIYGPIVSAFGGELEIKGRWTDSTVNASAHRDRLNPKKWIVTMFGGLARRPEITVDGFVLVLCHEIGHQVAGFPFVSDWAANEGQSDYFASLECAKQFWQNDTTANAAAQREIPGFAKQRCDDIWSTESARDLCYRTLMASKSTSDLLAALGDETVEINTPDTSNVTVTDNSHPAAQCRLDTYVAGALCVAHFDKNVIPGVNKADRNSTAAEEESSQYTCTSAGQYQEGLRPSCWFKARL